MYEGSPTTRGIQVVAGILLGCLTGLCLFVGLVAFYAIVFQNNFDRITIVLGLIFTPIGIIGLLISKRLVTARGVKQGAGLLAPREYRCLGYFFIVISLFMLLYGIASSTAKHIYLSPVPLLLTYFCFVASRFRQGMKSVPKWEKT